MSDFDSRLPVRGTALDLTTEIADSAGSTINPAKEDGNLLSIKTNTDKFTFTSTRLLVDGSGVTQPVSGTITANQGTSPWVNNLTQVGGSALALGQTTMSASVPVTIASNQSVLSINTAQIAGTTTSVNTGNADAGTIRVVIASNQPAIAVSTGAGVFDLPQYNTASAVAASASSTQTFTPGATFNLEGVDASASGQMKIEVQYGTTGSETTKWVGFTSKGNLQSHFVLPHPVQITTSMSVKVIRTNVDNQAMDVYSTILGY